MMENSAFTRRMKELGFTQDELACQMNDALQDITGRPGDVSARSVRNLVNGTTRRPIGRTCAALERVFGCPVEDLGFSRPRTANHPEMVPVLRRSVLVAAASAATVPAMTGCRTVGVSDVDRLRTSLDRLHDTDQATGGTTSIEHTALSHAEAALDLVQKGSASTRVRNMLFALASDATTTAGWAAIDGHRHEAARHHLEQAMTLAGMSTDGYTQFRVWNSFAILANVQNRRTEALAAAQAMRSTTTIRNDPLRASLAHARVAVAHARLGERTNASRALDHARNSLDRSCPGPRPSWIAFYDLAELDGLAGVCMLDLGAADQAEYHVHRTLARIKPHLVRNRTLYTIDLATAQLRQGEIDQAIITVQGVEETADTVHGSGRLRRMLGDFQRELITLAPDASATRDYLSSRKGNR